MNARTPIAILAGSLLLACAPMPPSPRPGALSMDCNTAAPGAQCNVSIAPGTQYRCELGTFDVSPDVLRLTGGNAVPIFWKLREPFAFCGRDQVYLKPGVNADTLQPYESFGSETEDGSRGPNLRVAGTCKQQWHWNWSNTGSDLYVYNIQFTDTRTGRKCTIDPFIRNG